MTLKEQDAKKCSQRRGQKNWPLTAGAAEVTLYTADAWNYPFLADGSCVILWRRKLHLVGQI